MPSLSELDEIEARVAATSLPALLRYLEQFVPLQSLAHLVDERLPGRLTAWKRGRGQPARTQEDLLRQLATVVEVLAEREGSRAHIDLWLGWGWCGGWQGGRVPAGHALRQGRYDEVSQAALVYSRSALFQGAPAWWGWSHIAV